MIPVKQKGDLQPDSQVFCQAFCMEKNLDIDRVFW